MAVLIRVMLLSFNQQIMLAVVVCVVVVAVRMQLQPVGNLQPT